MAEQRNLEFLCAVARNDSQHVRAMIESGHDINGRDFDNRTALMVAVSKSENDPSMIDVSAIVADVVEGDERGSYFTKTFLS